MAGTTRAYIGLGGNVGDAQATLQRAVAQLAALPGARVVAVSPLYRTKPVGDPDQPDFLNAVAALDVSSGSDPASGAVALLVELKRLEQLLGRQERRRWGPREVDLDVLLFGHARLAIEKPLNGTPGSETLDRHGGARFLEVPHPAMRDRLFVLAPLADLAPALIPPGWDLSVAAARDRIASAEPDAISRVGSWSRDRWLPQAVSEPGPTPIEPGGGTG